MSWPAKVAELDLHTITAADLEVRSTGRLTLVAGKY